MGSCNSTEIEASNTKIKANIKKNKNLFQSKKLRNLKENIENKFNKNHHLPFPLVTNKYKTSEPTNIKKVSSIHSNDNDDSYTINEHSLGIEHYDNSSIVHLQFIDSKRVSQASSDQFPLIDRDSIVNIESYEILTEISVSLNQTTCSTVHQMANFGTSSIPTSMNNKPRPAASAPISRFGFKPVASNVSLPVSSIPQVNSSSKPSQCLLQVIYFTLCFEY